MKKFNNDNEFDKFFRDELFNLEKEPPYSVFDKLITSIQTKSLSHNYKNWYWFGGLSLAMLLFIFIYNPFTTYQIVTDANKITNNYTKIENKLSNQLPISNYKTKESLPENSKILIEHPNAIKKEIPVLEKKISDKEPIIQNLINELNKVENPINKIKINYQVQITAASCRKNNGKVNIKTNLAGIQFYWKDLEISSESIDDLRSGKYIVLAKNENQILDTLYVNVPDSGNIIADFKVYDILIGNELVTIFENNTLIDKQNWKNQKDAHFYWNFGDGSMSYDAEPQHSFKNSGTYQISLNITSKYGCKDSLSKSYIITIPQNFAELPNIFSPNDDGINDYFQPVYYDLQSIECDVFNRNGELIYQWNELNGKWDGRIRNTNQIASPGTYYYILKGITKQGKNILHKGMVQLVM